MPVAALTCYSQRPSRYRELIDRFLDDKLIPHLYIFGKGQHIVSVVAFLAILFMTLKVLLSVSWSTPGGLRDEDVHNPMSPLFRDPASRRRSSS